MNFIWSLRGPARTSSCGASLPARDDDHDPASPALARRTLALANRTPARAPGIRRPAAPQRVGRQDLGARPGPLGLVQVVCVVRVHGDRPFVGEVFALSPRRRTASPAMDTTWPAFSARLSRAAVPGVRSP